MEYRLFNKETLLFPTKRVVMDVSVFEHLVEAFVQGKTLARSNIKVMSA